MALIKCPECSAEISDRADCCPKCGAPVVVHKSRCPQCGNMISEEPCKYCAEKSKIQLDTNQQHTEDKNHTGEPAFVRKHKRNLKIVLSISGCIIAFMVIFLIAIQSPGGGSNGSRLNGEYIVHTELADNLINFAPNGGFARYSRTFGDWELVTGGKYTLNGSSLTLRTSDGRTWEFQYDRTSDTLWQIGTNLYFKRYS